MRKILLVLALPFVTSLCNSEPAPIQKEPAPKPTVLQDTVETVVRIDMGGKYRGPGVAVSANHLVTSLVNLNEYVFWKYRVSVGNERLPGTIVAVDETRGIALIRTEKPLKKWVTFPSLSDIRANDPAVVVGYIDTDSVPPMIERRQISATISSVHGRGEGTGRLNVQDMATVSIAFTDGKLHAYGSGVFTPHPDLFVGLVIGTTGHSYDTSFVVTAPLLVLPAPSVAVFLKAQRVTPKTQ